MLTCASFTGRCDPLSVTRPRIVAVCAIPTAGAIIVGFTPDRLRSRATGALRFVNYGVRPLGALAGGALGSAFGLRPTLWFAAAAGVLGVLWLVPSPVPKLLELPEEEPV